MQADHKLNGLYPVLEYDHPSWCASGFARILVTKGQLISKCLFEVSVWTKIPTKILIIPALKEPGQKLSKFSLVFWSKR